MEIAFLRRMCTIHICAASSRRLLDRAGYMAAFLCNVSRKG
jgi:hypothetical protein